MGYLGGKDGEGRGRGGGGGGGGLGTGNLRLSCILKDCGGCGEGRL